jgi:hypothetical protein
MSQGVSWNGLSMFRVEKVSVLAPYGLDKTGHILWCGGKKRDEGVQKWPLEPNEASENTPVAEL